MKKELFKEIEIPENVEIEIDESIIKIKGPQGMIERHFNIRDLEFKKENGKIIIGHKKSSKKEKKDMNSIAAHIKNMIKGVQNKFEYKLKICFSHFPFTLEIKGNEASIKNFLGEKVPRRIKIPIGAEIKMDKEMITISSVDKELVGRIAADLERITKVRNRDRRVFQDGIYLVSRNGEEI